MDTGRSNSPKARNRHELLINAVGLSPTLDEQSLLMQKQRGDKIRSGMRQEQQEVEKNDTSMRRKLSGMREKWLVGVASSLFLTLNLLVVTIQEVYRLSASPKFTQSR